MAKNIIFNDTTYPIDESKLAPATAELQSHLSTAMNGSGATINFGGTAYNVDSTKLSTATNIFVSHLKTVEGDDSQVVVGGVAYSVDASKLANAVEDMHSTLSGLAEPIEPALPASEGLEFALNNDGASYSVVGIGTCEDTDIVIPDTHEGLSVTTIGEAAFSDQNKLISIFIPDSVTTIENYAFYDCTSLTDVTLGNNVAYIGETAFHDNKSLVNINIPNSVKKMGLTVFDGCSKLATTSWGPYKYLGNSENPYLYLLDMEFHSSGTYEHHLIHEKTRFIGLREQCACVLDLIIPEEVVFIDQWAFWGANLVSVSIPKTVTHIGPGAFWECYELRSVEFTGTVEEWNKIELGYMAFSFIAVDYVQCSDGQVELNIYEGDGEC